MTRPPRIALFTDTFHEVNGVALTCRQFAAYAASHGAPFLRVHPGAETRAFRDGAQQVCELASSRLAIRFETDLRFDLRFLRHKAMLRAQLEGFAPQWIHITSPGHISGRRSDGRGEGTCCVGPSPGVALAPWAETNS